MSVCSVCVCVCLYTQMALHKKIDELDLFWWVKFALHFHAKVVHYILTIYKSNY